MNTTVEAMLTEILPKASVQELVERYGDPYDALFHAEESEWYDAPGMGNRGIAKLRAIKSIIKNVQNRPRKASINVGRPIDIYKAMSDMQYFETEHVRVLYLNARNNLIKSEDISIGDVTTASLDIKCIFSSAVRVKACGIVIVHNHPSGDSHPSELDIRCTKRVAEAGRLFDIPVLDHIIIGHGEFHSMSECGQL